MVPYAFPTYETNNRVPLPLAGLHARSAASLRAAAYGGGNQPGRISGLCPRRPEASCADVAAPEPRRSNGANEDHQSYGDVAEPHDDGDGRTRRRARVAGER